MKETCATGATKIDWPDARWKIGDTVFCDFLYYATMKMPKCHPKPVTIIMPPYKNFVTFVFKTGDGCESLNKAESRMLRRVLGIKDNDRITVYPNHETATINFCPNGNGQNSEISGTSLERMENLSETVMTNSGGKLKLIPRLPSF